MSTSIIEKIFKSLGKLYVSFKKPKVVVVAGSVGKTSTKIFLSTILSSEKNISYMDDSYNSGIGLYLSVFRQKVPTNLTSALSWLKILTKVLLQFFQKGPEILILEYGIDQPGEMDEMINFIRPNISILTAVTPEHMELLLDIDTVAKEELKITSASKEYSVINNVDIDAKYTKNLKGKIYRYGDDKFNASYKINEWTKKGVIVSFEIDGLKIDKIDVKLISEPLIRQLTGAILLAKLLGISQKSIIKSIEKIEPTFSRMVMLEGVKDSILIDDTTNFSPIAGIEALKALKRIPGKRHIAVLGNMHELGEYANKGFGDVAQHFKKDIDMLVLVGSISIENFSKYAIEYGFKENKDLFFFDDSVTAGIFLRDKIVQKDDVILVKGPFGGYYLEETVKKLLKDPKDSVKLTRQSSFWIIKKRRHFGPNFDK